VPLSLKLFKNIGTIEVSQLLLLLSMICRRLRDKLIQDERLKLAMDVSTKCGLDPSGVWGAWGLTCIKQGDYAGAREKFGRCLKVRVCSK